MTSSRENFITYPKSRYLLLWYRQRKHEKAVKRHQKILDKQRLKRASLNARGLAGGFHLHGERRVGCLCSVMAANDSAEALARKTGVGDTGQNYDGDYHHEKGPKEVTCEHRSCMFWLRSSQLLLLQAGARRHDHHRRKVKERTRPRVSASPLPVPARDRSMPGPQYSMNDSC